jgi:hypothetical protein
VRKEYGKQKVQREEEKDIDTVRNDSSSRAKEEYVGEE